MITDAIERLGLMASICIDFASALPQTCADTATEAWRMLDGVLSKHGNVRSVSDVTCKLIRVGVDFFGPLAHPLAPAIIERLTQAWTLTNLSSYMWATAKFAKVLPQSCPSSDPVYKALSQAFDQQTRHVSEFLSNNQMSRNEDGES